ncbi:MAG: arginyltransferase, partial [Planctomycetota bacterium]
GRLIGVAIVDAGQSSLSAVYTYFDPLVNKYSVGTYAILTQLQWAIDHDYQWLYLGMYVADNSHLNYKARFRPQQRLIEGEWQRIEQAIEHP